ncbi:50S ribosomal protein L25 [Clostridium botulinum]|uniref:Large ribosomal subunit protein bL25 n=1 Tax=Clostridium botulinum TaxID=1491 RepID=A0A9Q1UWN7_CLOBO|nr:50S ribosomal protein L25 [Clostridium botulinum]AEB74775.1 ribosomal 5S rRNA E-loop binding protein Ctc/L25/TL5 [Clostridium botulinum BKT015925]KEI01374.1 5S rRNA E-loop-binding protein [Clostridium botulinum C/D str. Sp77]KEI02805.1 5S rRNA E-loop-binding protein [Clostridium botulinum D str. 16868]KLU76208.1 5S rRNA E-loop-binding protein [Clostridium botulinum V891]KOA72851.1 5S rRNA E-loop-binding protein [Clostridium botulinum]
MSQVAIAINEREKTDTNGRLRRNGQVPCIMYGEHLEKAIPIKVNYNQLIRILKTNSKGSILKLQLNNQTKNCVIKEIQKDTVTGKIIHIDFQNVSKDEIIKMTIPIEFTGIDKLQSKRLILETFITEIDMQGKVQEIPETIKIDASKMNFNNKLFIHDIKLPEGIRLLSDPNALVAVINSTDISSKDDEETE